MASDASSLSASSDGLAQCLQNLDQPKFQTPDHISYHAPCSYTGNHVLPHLQQLQYGHIDEAFLSQFPAAAMHLMAWQWPSNLGINVAPRTIPRQNSGDSFGQSSNQATAESGPEFYNQLNGYQKQLPRLPIRYDQAQQQHQQQQQQFQYPHFMQVAQRSDVHDLHAQNLAFLTEGQESSMLSLNSEIAPHLISRSVVNAHAGGNSIPLPGTVNFQPQQSSNHFNKFPSYPNCANSVPKLPSFGASFKNLNVQSNQGEESKLNCQSNNENPCNLPAHCCEDSLHPHSAHHVAPPLNRLFPPPTSSAPLIPQEGQGSACMDEFLSHQYPRVSCNYWLPSFGPLVNVNPNEAAAQGAHWSTLPPVAALTASAAAARLWGQVGGSSVYPARSLHHVPPTQVISTPFPSSSASTTLSALFNTLPSSSSSNSISNSSPLQLSAQSAFSYMTANVSPLLRPAQNTKATGCQMQFLNQASIATQIGPMSIGSPFEEHCSSQQAVGLAQSRREECSQTDHKHPLHFHSSERVSASPSAAGTFREVLGRCCGNSTRSMSNSGVSSIVTKETSQAPSTLRIYPSYHTATSPTQAPSSSPRPAERPSKEPLDCRLPRQDQGRSPECTMRGPSQSGAGRYPQGGYAGDRPAEFCKFLDQDQNHVFMRNSHYAAGRDELKKLGALSAIPCSQALDFANAPSTQMSGVEKPVLSDERNATQRQPGVKGQWGAAEDRVLSKLVKRYGTRRWSLISTFMASKSLFNIFRVYLHWKCTGTLTIATR